MKSQAIASQGLPLAHKIHFIILSSLLDVKLDQEAGFYKELLSKAEMHKGMSKQFYLATKELTRPCLQMWEMGDLSCWWSNRILLRDILVLNIQLSDL